MCRLDFLPAFRSLSHLLLPALLLGLAAVSGSSGAAWAQTLTVTKTADTDDGACDQDCSLREAINAFNERNFFGGDFVIEIPMGTYRLTIPGAGESDGATGDLDVVAIRPAATLEIRGAGREATVLDAGRNDRVLEILALRMDVTIRDLTVRNGRTQAAGQDGGGISSDANLTLRRVRLEGNEVASASSNDGGGLFSFGPATLIDCVVSNNSTATGLGGGIFGREGLTITDSTISENRADGPAGAGGGVASQGPLALTRSTISGNSAGGDRETGGGVFVQGSLEAVNSTISGNHAPRGEGGGLALKDGGASLLHVTLTGNTAGAGGSALFVDPEGVVDAANTLIDGRCLFLAGGSLTSSGGNVESPASTCGLDDAVDQNGVSRKALALGTLGPNGGPTLTHALLDGSVARDRGLRASCADIDQRGIPRPVDGDGDGDPDCDVGAFEAEDSNGPVGGGPCVEDELALCLSQNRFRVTAAFATPSSSSGSARATELTNDTGYFWFFDQDNVEIVVKVLDGCAINGRYWVFAGGLTDVRVELTVEDIQTGAVRTYDNPASTPFQPIQDLEAFATCP